VAIVGVLVAVALLTPFHWLGQEEAFIGVPGALAALAVVTSAVVGGPWVGLSVAVACGLTFDLVVYPKTVLLSHLSTAAVIILYVAAGWVSGALADRYRRTQSETRALYRRFQENLTPSLATSTTAFSLHALSVPGEERMLLGGDFVDAVELDSGALAVIVGDVTGHGPDAAALGANLRAAWRALALGGTDPIEIVHRLDGVLARESSVPAIAEQSGVDIATLATLCCGYLLPHEQQARLVLAGHPPPLVIGAGATALDARPGLPLGVSTDAERSLVSIDLAGTRGVLFYTDGLVEGRASPGSAERYGIDRLARRVTRVAGGGSLDGNLPRTILAEAEVANGGPFADDVTILLVTPHGAGASDAQAMSAAAQRRDAGAAP
jgi:serine phosphatase RsbU (regulator of sigma subunit)